MEADMPSVMGPLQHLRADLETKFDTGKTEGTFSGYAAVFGNVDSYGDVIERGAFKATLRARDEKGKLPPMLLQPGGGFLGGGSDELLPIGQWTLMVENPTGRWPEGRRFALPTERGQAPYEGR